MVGGCAMMTSIITIENRYFFIHWRPYPDLGAFTRGTFYRNAPTNHNGAFLHRLQAHTCWFLVGIKTAAIVTEHQLNSLFIVIQIDAHLTGMAMPGDISQGFLADATQ